MNMITDLIVARTKIIAAWAKELSKDDHPITPLEIREYIRQRWPDMKQPDRDILISEVMDTVGTVY